MMELVQHFHTVLFTQQKNVANHGTFIHTLCSTQLWKVFSFLSYRFMVQKWSTYPLAKT